MGTGPLFNPWYPCDPAASAGPTHRPANAGTDEPVETAATLQVPHGVVCKTLSRSDPLLPPRPPVRMAWPSMVQIAAGRRQAAEIDAKANTSG